MFAVIIADAAQIIGGYMVAFDDLKYYAIGGNLRFVGYSLYRSWIIPIRPSDQLLPIFMCIRWL